MEDYPTALRLKELETLEKVTDKVGNISVFGGLDGVLDQMVRIKRQEAAPGNGGGFRCLSPRVVVVRRRANET
jgi:hypothetical protein